MHTRRIYTMAGAVYLVLALAATAAAGPITVGGFYSTQPYGAITSSELTLTFPTFAVNISDNDFPNGLSLRPGFDVTNGSPVPFTQTTGTFSRHSLALPNSGIIDADVTGSLSFFGPTDTVHVPDDCGFMDCQQLLIESITWSGVLTVRSGGNVLFDGTLRGTGTATTLFGTFPPSQFWQGTDYRLTGGAASVPEPASILLFGSGVAWLAARRRRVTAVSRRQG